MRFDITNRIYHDPLAARRYIEAKRWPKGPICPRCQQTNAIALEGGGDPKGRYQCQNQNCAARYSVTTDTFLADSRIPLHKWVLCAHLVETPKPKLSARVLGRYIGVSPATALFMVHRLQMDQTFWKAAF